MSIDTIAIPTTTGTTGTESTKAVNQHDHHNTPRLPPELWLIIFRFATSSPITYPNAAADPDPTTGNGTGSSHDYYEPFQPLHHETAIALSDAAVRDRCAITLVCRQWRALAGDMRYEDIRIGHGVAALLAALSEPAPDTNTDTDNDTTLSSSSSPLPRNRIRVRRAVLPYAHTATPTYHVPPALELLALLPNLEVLVRPPFPPPIPFSQLAPLPDPPRQSRTLIPITPTPTRHPYPYYNYNQPTPTPRFEFPTPTPVLPALQRLEWAFDRTGAAARAGGINSLTDMLRAVAPSLRELVLTGPMPHAAFRQDRLPPLRALRTLRLRGGACGCALVNLQTSYWAMPALTHLVVEGGGRARTFEALWGANTFGPLVALRVVQVELGGLGVGRSLRGMGMSRDDVRVIVGACPGLEELNFRIGRGHLDSWSPPMDDSDDSFVRAVSESAEAAHVYVHDALQRLGICCVDSDADAEAEAPEEWTVKTWMALAAFVEEWKACPALRQVVLYVRDRDVQVAERNPQFRLLRGELASSGKQLLLRSVWT